jgi:hypothetical protein
MTTLQYDLSTGTWTNPSGVSGTDWLPDIVFGAAPTWQISVSGPVPPGLADAVSFRAAVARDWLAGTLPMSRAMEGVEVSEGADALAATVPIDTRTERFLRVVDGHGCGVRCWLQVAGLDASGILCWLLTAPVLARPALDPEGSGSIPPIDMLPVTTAVQAAQSAATDAAAAAASAAQSAQSAQGFAGSAAAAATDATASATLAQEAQTAAETAQAAAETAAQTASAAISGIADYIALATQLNAALEEYDADTREY